MTSKKQNIEVFDQKWTFYTETAQHLKNCLHMSLKLLEIDQVRPTEKMRISHVCSQTQSKWRNQYFLRNNSYIAHKISQKRPKSNKINKT